MPQRLPEALVRLGFASGGICLAPRNQDQLREPKDYVSGEYGQSVTMMRTHEAGEREFHE